MDERRRNQIIIGVVLGAIGCGCLIWFTVIAAAIFYPVFVRARGRAQQVQCLHNQLQIARALTQYVADYGDTFPPASRWTDEVRPYLGYEVFLQCPSARHLECGYAFYQPLSSRKIKEISQPSYIPMLFDSTKGQRNYADNGQSLAFRHLNGVVVTFVDGHVRWLEETEAKRVFKQQNKP